MTASTRTTVACVAAALILIAIGGAGCFFYSRTIVQLWIPIAIAVAAAAITGLRAHRLWRPLTDSAGFWPNYICHLIGGSTVAFTLILGLNFTLADKSTEHTEQAVVEKKYSEKHYSTRRAGRRTYTSGTPYYEYYIRLRLPDGRIKDMNVPLSRYNRIRTGSVYPLEVEAGLLGMPVIESFPGPPKPAQ